MQNHTDAIIARFQNLTCSVLNSGVNVYYHKYVITIWWRKQSYCNTKNHKWVRFTSLEAIIDVIEQSAYPKAKKVVHIEPEAPQTTNSTQQCIDHILKKIEIGKKVNGNNAVITMLIALCEELTQFL